MCGGRGIWEIFVHFTQFCYEPKTSLKQSFFFFFFLIRSSTTTWAFPGPSAGRRWEAKHLQAPRRVMRRGSPRLSGRTAFSATSAHAGRLPLPARSQAAAPA